MNLKVSDIRRSDEFQSRAKIIQRKTSNAVQFEISKRTQIALCDWCEFLDLDSYDWLFPSRMDRSQQLSTHQYSRLVARWVASIELPRSSYSTHSLKRTKATLIYRKTGNLRAVQLLLGHSKIDSTVRYLGVEVGDALARTESIDL
ncbi:MAG: tyrosine-type recombinase/integrase [Parasphingorhabdus sp.]|uniref:tyrosine-type recombinase/integrase n=1 Tax=Parasphingorhabdus sp. TaxID=2709688 RepID=UPI003298B0FE